MAQPTAQLETSSSGVEQVWPVPPALKVVATTILTGVTTTSSGDPAGSRDAERARVRAEAATTIEVLGLEADSRASTSAPTTSRTDETTEINQALAFGDVDSIASYDSNDE